MFADKLMHSDLESESQTNSFESFWQEKIGWIVFGLEKSVGDEGNEGVTATAKGDVSMLLFFISDDLRMFRKKYSLKLCL